MSGKQLYRIRQYSLGQSPTLYRLKRKITALIGHRRIQVTYLFIACVPLLRFTFTQHRHVLRDNFRLISFNTIFLPAPRADLSFNYYFNASADWSGAEDFHDDGYELSLALEYDWPIPLRTSAGALYTVTGAGDHSYQIENPALDSYTLGLGARYALNDRLGLTAAWAGNFAMEDELAVASFNTTAQLEKRVIIYALGIDYRLF